MVVKGWVRNGAIVIRDCAELVEGQEVLVHSLPVPSLNSAALSVIDIAPVRLGAVLNLNVTDDLLGEMLEGRL